MTACPRSNLGDDPTTHRAAEDLQKLEALRRCDPEKTMRIMVVQYAGDYEAAYKLSVESGTETYYGHQYVLQCLSDINTTFGETAIICCRSPTVHDVKLPSGLRVIGAGGDVEAAIRIVKAFAPTHLVVLGPLRRFIKLGLAGGQRIFCLCADSFELHPLRRFFRYGRLAALLNNDRVEWIANHGISSCLSLERLGVSPAKIIPWDWPHARQPKDVECKLGASGRLNLFFAGVVTERKGVRDLITAVAILKERGLSVVAKIAGAGEIDKFKSVAKALKVEADIEFLGLVTNSAVVRMMREATAVVVPSQHAYPEGLPLTIYEALCARTPVVASDHPMFVNRLSHERTAMIYRSGKPAELASAVAKLVHEPSLYSALSEASQTTWETLQIRTKWGDLLSRWLGDQPEDREWLRLASDGFAEQASRGK